MGNDRCTIQYDELIRDQEMSWLLHIDGRDIWFAKSISTIDEDECTIELPMWLIEKEGLESYIAYIVD